MTSPEHITPHGHRLLSRRHFMRKAYLGVQLSQCQQAGPQSMPVYFPSEFPPRARAIIDRVPISGRRACN